MPYRGIAAKGIVQPGLRGEPEFGDECSRGLNLPRRPVEKTGGEKLTHESVRAPELFQNAASGGIVVTVC